MAKYTKRPDFSSVHIPGFGMLSGTQVIEGDYDRFVPALLVKVTDSAAAPKAQAVETTTPGESAKQADPVAARSDESEDEPAPKQASAPAPKSKAKK